MARKKNAVETTLLTHRDYLKAVTRKMLKRLEDMMDHEDVFTDSDVIRHVKLQESLFGAKSSLVASLVTLSELLLRLEEEQHASSAMGYLQAPAELSEADVELVKAFVCKIPDREAAPAELTGQRIY